MRNYTDSTKPQTVARYFGIARQGKSGLNWTVNCLEREYVNYSQDDTDFFKDNNGFNFPISVSNLADSFPIVDPSTLEPTAMTMTIGEAMNIIQSMYIFKARERDNSES